jgi:hypothetical protein
VSGSPTYRPNRLGLHEVAIPARPRPRLPPAAQRGRGENDRLLLPSCVSLLLNECADLRGRQVRAGVSVHEPPKRNDEWQFVVVVDGPEVAIDNFTIMLSLIKQTVRACWGLRGVRCLSNPPLTLISFLYRGRCRAWTRCRRGCACRPTPRPRPRPSVSGGSGPGGSGSGTAPVSFTSAPVPRY